MGEPQHVGATFLADVFGSSTACPVFICSLINGDAREGAGAGERFVTTRTPEYISAFARKWDIARRGVYWCVSTVARDARRRAKETLAELNCLHADIDFKELARKYKMSGGYVRNSVLRAAFLAAREGRPISQSFLERAIKLEYREGGNLIEGGVLE